jgi:hypothetical protein
MKLKYVLTVMMMVSHCCVQMAPVESVMASIVVSDSFELVLYKMMKMMILTLLLLSMPMPMIMLMLKMEMLIQ